MKILQVYFYLFDDELQSGYDFDVLWRNVNALLYLEYMKNFLMMMRFDDLLLFKKLLSKSYCSSVKNMAL